MPFPPDLKYTKEHEWVKVEGAVGRIGVTDYAQKKMGDIVYVELPSIGQTVKKGDTVVVLESVKAVSDCYAPVSGRVAEVNETLLDQPGLVNQDPYGSGWLVVIELSDPSELEELLDCQAYEALINSDESE